MVVEETGNKSMYSEAPREGEPDVVDCECGVSVGQF
jgi:hypothetical protein